MNSSRLIICNRANPISADGGFIHIVPKGELFNSGAGIVQVLDDKALDSILANFAADKKRLGDKWPGLYAGLEHWIYEADQSSAALAWFKDFEKRPDGIWASDEGLTDLGREAIQNKRFKFTSFVADPRDTQSLGGNRVRILKIDTVGFTNAANGKDLLTPITNRANEDDPVSRVKEVADIASAGEAANHFASHVATIKADMKCTDSEAFQIAKTKHADLFAKMGKQPASYPVITNRAPGTQPDNNMKDAMQKFSDQVRSTMKERGWDWGKSWAYCKNKHPELSKAAQDQTPPIEQILDEGKVKNRIRFANRFNKEVFQFQNANSCSFQTAWDHIKNREPELFAGMTAK